MNILKNALLLMFALLWVSSAHASVASNLVLNGNFETVDETTSIGGYAGALEDLPSGRWAIYESLPYWSSNIAGIEVHRGQVASNLDNPANNHYVELDTKKNSNMFQEISGLREGAWYTLTFDYFNRTGDESSTINYSLGSYNGVADFTTMAWYTISETFKFSGEAVLSFIADGKSNGSGGFIDNVSLTSAVPLPGAAILFGSGLLGLVGLRRRQIV